MSNIFFFLNSVGVVRATKEESLKRKRGREKRQIDVLIELRYFVKKICKRIKNR
jgi:hypothetical protein